MVKGAGPTMLVHRALQPEFSSVKRTYYSEFVHRSAADDRYLHNATGSEPITALEIGEMYQM